MDGCCQPTVAASTCALARYGGQVAAMVGNLRGTLHWLANRSCERSERLAKVGGRYWTRTSDPRRVKADDASHPVAREMTV